MESNACYHLRSCGHGVATCSDTTSVTGRDALTEGTAPMAVPKRKTGRMKTHSRRSSHILEAPAKSTCPQCHEVKLPHRVCPTCGFYKDREVIDTE
jgi:large subunit ribosomal protein L32